VRGAVQRRQHQFAGGGQIVGGAGPDATALLNRFGRLVKQVAREHGGTADKVSDLARVSRVPGTVNRKFPDEPVPVFAMPRDDWRPVSLEELRDTLNTLAVPEYDEDREVLGAVVSDPHGWGCAKHWPPNRQRPAPMPRTRSRSCDGAPTKRTRITRIG
jgi:hypothetical protein